ncbi:leucine efflux protein LeuE [Streptomyces thermolineatus]|uniref:leucine efflux protein LeuE n=1 Tax=Streptomyces thermolineatus TaxID=44033 RepID=UPI00384F75F8
MLGVNDLSTYVIGTVLIVLLPGPNSLYALSVAARGGVRAGYRAAFGVLCGDTVLMTLAAAGAASLLQTNAMLFAVVKYAGAAYLAWIAIGMLRSATTMWRARHEPAGAVAEAAADAAADASGTAGATGPGAAVPGERPFRKALAISLLNPKAILFVISFFVQFVDPAYPHQALSFLLLGGILQFFSFCYLSTLILAGTYLAAQFRRRRRLSAGLTSGAGALFLGFAAKLSVASAG